MLFTAASSHPAKNPLRLSALQCESSSELYAVQQCVHQRGLWFRGTGILRLWEIGTARSTMWEIGTFCRFERMLELPAKTTQTRSVFKLPSAPCLLIASRLSSRPTPSRTKKGSNMLLTASCRYTILTPSHRAHHCLRRPSGGPAGGYCRSSADPVACGAPRASAAKDRCTFLACGALFRTNESKGSQQGGAVRRRPERCIHLLPRLREARRRRRGLPRIGSSRRQAPRRAAGGNGELGAPHNILYKHHV